jgi:very-short-patch-repair endonuclease
MNVVNYLTEESLGEFLKQRVAPDFIHNKAFPGYRFRPDYRSESLKLVIEFDGYLHYTSSARCVADLNNSDIIVDAGYKIIRIPYFVQLDSRVVELLFPNITDKSGFSNYPHGFIDRKAILPADFCTLGLERFMIEIDYFGCIAQDIWNSLTTKQQDPRTVMPNYFHQVLGVS